MRTTSPHFAMRRARLTAALAVVAATAIITTSIAWATSFSTNSWNCAWSGGSTAGYGWTNHTGGSCEEAGVQVDWYYGGTWYSNLWAWETLYTRSNATGSLSSTHQVVVANEGYGQKEYSWY